MSDLRQQLTLVLVTKDRHVLLGLKKTGFGSGRINALGGKIEPGESPLGCALRELEEECGLKAKEATEVARIFVDYDHTGKKVELHVFEVTDFRGEVHSTLEMDVDWTSIDHVPYEKMWANDIYWLPSVLNGKRIHASFHLSDDETVIDQKIEEWKV